MTKDTDFTASNNEHVNAKLDYQTPELKEFGMISNIFKANSGVGTDGGAFTNDTLS